MRYSTMIPFLRLRSNFLFVAGHCCDLTQGLYHISSSLRWFISRSFSTGCPVYMLSNSRCTILICSNFEFLRPYLWQSAY